MDKSERIIRMWLSILNRRSFIVSDLAKEFEVSTRTVHRDLDYLSELGVPIYSNVGKGGGFKLLNNTLTPPIAFSENEILSIVYASTMLKSLGTSPYDIEINYVREKLLFQIPTSLREKSNAIDQHLEYVLPSKNTDLKFLKEIFQASLEKNELELDYSKEESNVKYRLISIGIYSYNGFWYFVGFLLKSQIYKIYRIDRVCNLKILDKLTNEKIKEIKTLKEWMKLLDEKKEEVTIQFKVSKNAYRSITDHWILQGTKNIVSETEYLIDFSCPHSQVKFIVPQLLQLGGEAKVLEPKEVRDQIIDTINKMRIQYEV
ncbi:helix-turn-helix transcriptional regulator [Shouchella miscanthi]|uniref:helix-turn-helix transcriptional regulator n=1 Tax=Shouchella miscanthi TaxID=2598861 RepID=UPI00119F4D60|nr:YafY family protein [Shouchella miscanthi]